MNLDLFDFSMHEPTWYPCPHCGRESSSAKECWDCFLERQTREERETRLRDLDRSIPELFAETTFEHPKLSQWVANPSQIEVAKRAVDAKRVVLVGQAGKGKTTLVTCMLRAWAAKRNGVAMFLPSFRLSGGTFTLDDAVLNADLVIIDDLGTERQMASSLLPELVYERHARDLATWVTTWMYPAQVSQRYGDGVARRLFEGAVKIYVDRDASNRSAAE